MCDISGYGDDGPYRDKKAYDLLIQSEAGFLSVTGTPETPSKAGPSIADIAAVPFVKRIEEEIAPDEVTRERHPLVADWWSRVQARPAFGRADIGPFTDRPAAA